MTANFLVLKNGFLTAPAMTDEEACSADGGTKTSGSIGIVSGSIVSLPSLLETGVFGLVSAGTSVTSGSPVVGTASVRGASVASVATTGGVELVDSGVDTLILFGAIVSCAGGLGVVDGSLLLSLGLSIIISLM